MSAEREGAIAELRVARETDDDCAQNKWVGNFYRDPHFFDNYCKFGEGVL